MGVKRVGEYIRTFTGRQFWPLDPRPEELCIEDIAHGLALCNRFNGHTRVPYSVAQHCVLMVEQLEMSLGHFATKRWALLHDASEAYLGDMVRPLKVANQLEAYREAEEGLMAVIAQRFELPVPMPWEVKELDQQILRAEQRDLMCGSTGWENSRTLEIQIEPWPWWEAEARFLLAFCRLWPSFDAIEAVKARVSTVPVKMRVGDLFRIVEEHDAYAKMLRDFGFLSVKMAESVVNSAEVDL